MIHCQAGAYPASPFSALLMPSASKTPSREAVRDCSASGARVPMAAPPSRMVGAPVATLLTTGAGAAPRGASHTATVSPADQASPVSCQE